VCEGHHLDVTEKRKSYTLSRNLLTVPSALARSSHVIPEPGSKCRQCVFRLTCSRMPRGIVGNFYRKCWFGIVFVDSMVVPVLTKMGFLVLDLGFGVQTSTVIS